jgi:hypothetical protein
VSLGPRVLRRSIVIAVLSAGIVLGGALLKSPVLRAAGAGQLGRANSWIATSTTGLTLTGTWTATPDPVSGSVAGQWTLVDARGATIARGGWSATKTPAGWSGAWRATDAGSKSEYAGTWTAAAGPRPDAPLSDLFDAASKAAVSGNWKAGTYSGAWTIRAYR